VERSRGRRLRPLALRFPAEAHSFPPTAPDPGQLHPLVPVRPHRHIPARLAAIVLCAWIAFPAGEAQAQELERVRLTGGLSWFGLKARDERAGSVELAVSREGPVRFTALRAGATVAWHGAAYAYAAGEMILRPHPRIVAIPSVGVGAYRRGGGVDLGSPLAFRSSFELGYRREGGNRISLFAYHLSNAGVGRRNPGIEAVGLAWSAAVPGSRSPTSRRRSRKRTMPSGG
jgi:lipid A 3-O-deacylase